VGLPRWSATTRSPTRPTTIPRASPGAAASITFQNDSPSERILGRASTMAPKMPPSSEIPPSHTRSASPSESYSPAWLTT
jgi:hypothetical protein